MRWRARFTLSASVSALMVSGLVLGISNTAVTPPGDRGAAAGLQILLLLQPRLAEMHLGVDDARQHVEVGGIDDLGRAGACQPADGGDAPLADADVALAAAVVIDDRAAFDEDVEGVRP